jgi:predicted lactoylglutathione lyase
VTNDRHVFISSVNVLAQDVDRLTKFYAELLSLNENLAQRTPIFRSLHGGTVQLGINAQKAYELLNISERRPVDDRNVRILMTFEASKREAVDDMAQRIESLGGGIVKLPHQTYYDMWQVVLQDPEGNIFRVNFRLSESSISSNGQMTN